MQSSKQSVDHFLITLAGTVGGDPRCFMIETTAFPDTGGMLSNRGGETRPEEGGLGRAMLVSIIIAARPESSPTGLLFLLEYRCRGIIVEQDLPRAWIQSQSGWIEKCDPESFGN